MFAVELRLDKLNRYRMSETAPGKILPARRTFGSFGYKRNKTRFLLLLVKKEEMLI